MKNYLILFTFLMITQSSYALIGGLESKGTEKNGIFHIVVINPEDEDDNGLCTATKIGRNLILTAAHCFDSDKNPSMIGYSTSSKNQDMEFEGLNVSAVYLHPSYNQESEDFGLPESDIAIVKIEPDEQFATLSTREIDLNELKVGEAVELWGHGCQKHVEKIDGYFPIKKTGTSVLLGKDALLKNNFGVATQIIREGSNNIYNDNFLTLAKGLDSKKPSLCFGDSGGPLIKDGKVVGVNGSFLTNFVNEEGRTKNGLAYINLHARLSVVSDWLKEIMN